MLLTEADAPQTEHQRQCLVFVCLSELFSLPLAVCLVSETSRNICTCVAPSSLAAQFV